METEVYADLLFLINAGMDGLCFCICSRILHRRLPPLRTVLASALGGLYAVAALFLPFDGMLAFLMDALVCLLLCGLVFATRRRRAVGDIALGSVVFVAVSMALGGIMTALFNLLNHVGVADLLPGATTEDGPTAWLFLLLAVASGICTLAGGRFFRRAAAVQTCRVTIELDGRTVTLDGMVDSGNLLKDPAGGLPVVTVDRAATRALLSPALRAACEDTHPNLATLSGHADGRRVRLIPCATAAGHSLLVAISPDRLWIAPTSGPAHEVRALFAPTALSSKDHLEALVPSELML